MDNLQKAMKMARIKLMLKIIEERKERKNRLSILALELMFAGYNKQEISLLIDARESLTPRDKAIVEEILITF